MMRSWLSGCAAFVAAVSAHAGDITPPSRLPEPETWALIALAGVVGYVVSRRKK